MVSGFCVVLSLYLRATLLLGRWPEVSRDDPKALSLGPHYTATGGAVAAWMSTTICMYAVLAILATKKSRRPELRRYLYVALLSTVLLMMSPWVSWYLD
jgi:hypothetical protein